MMGGNLTSIHSKEENEFLAGFASSHVGQNRYAWVGLHNPFRRPEEWRWIEGTSVDFKRDNPETTRINSEGFCALLKVDFSSGNRAGSWLGEACTTVHHSAVCSKPVKTLSTAK
ncbi:Protein CLEC-48 [Aphelenchoides avenae]|nr:Protein CLEC-48 [Aphelenchus avenae]